MTFKNHDMSGTLKNTHTAQQPLVPNTFAVLHRHKQTKQLFKATIRINSNIYPPLKLYTVITSSYTTLLDKEWQFVYTFSLNERGYYI